MLPSTASESLGKTRNESQFPLSSRTEQHHRTWRPVVFAQHTYRFIVEKMPEIIELIELVEDLTCLNAFEGKNLDK